MDSQTLREFRWFWAWEDEREEAWLRKMSQEGRHLESVAFPGLYTFRPGPPRDYVYRLDFNSNRKEFDHYVQLFTDAGWQRLAEYGSWQYFRKEARPGETPEIFTDNTSKVQKYRRVLLFLVLFLPILVVNLNVLTRRLGAGTLSPPAEGVYFALALVFFLLFLVYLYAMLKLLQRVAQLRRLKE